jgi:hypothetical protein
VYLSGPTMRREREARGLTQADVARAVNALAGELLAAQPGVSAIETGSDRRPFTEWQGITARRCPAGPAASTCPFGGPGCATWPAPSTATSAVFTRMLPEDDPRAILNQPVAAAPGGRMLTFTRGQLLAALSGAGLTTFGTGAGADVWDALADAAPAPPADDELLRQQAAEALAGWHAATTIDEGSLGDVLGAGFRMPRRERAVDLVGGGERGDAQTGVGACAPRVRARSPDPS